MLTGGEEVGRLHRFSGFGRPVCGRGFRPFTGREVDGWSGGTGVGPLTDRGVAG